MVKLYGKMAASLVIILCLIGVIIAKENITYTTKYDSVDLNEILGSERLLTGYVNCLLDRGPCTPDGNELKRHLPDAIDSDCHKCTERQREGSDQVMQYIIDHRPDDWRKLEEKYNSDGTYKKKYLMRKAATAENNQNAIKTEQDGTISSEIKPTN